MKELISIMPFVASALVFLIFIMLVISNRPRLYLESCLMIGSRMKKRGSESGWYKRTEYLLLSNGAKEHFGEWINPFSYLAANISLGMIICVVIGKFNWLIGILAGLVASRIIYVLLVYMNSQDNVKMLPEIKLIYNALGIQIRAGVYLTDALAECYGSVTEKRLRDALLELAGDIVVNGDAYLALESFQRKFNNRYIDGLCITLLQALESGQAIELLGDISDQIKDMEKTVLERKKASLDRKFTFYQLGMLVALMIVVLYACVTKMYTAVVNF